jgi:hypothetical protein
MIIAEKDGWAWSVRRQGEPTIALAKEQKGFQLLGVDE